MGELINYTISGAVTGAIYSLIAAGLILSYTATGIFNLSYAGDRVHGGVPLLRAPRRPRLADLARRPLVILVFGPLLGCAARTLAVFRPLAAATDAAKIMATVGLLVALPALAHWIVEKMDRRLRLDDPRRQPRAALSPASGRSPEGPGLLGDVPARLQPTSWCSWPPRGRRGAPVPAAAQDPAGPADAGRGRPARARRAAGRQSTRDVDARVDHRHHARRRWPAWSAPPIFGPLLPDRYTQFVFIACGRRGAGRSARRSRWPSPAAS